MYVCLSGHQDKLEPLALHFDSISSVNSFFVSVWTFAIRISSIITLEKDDLIQISMQVPVFILLTILCALDSIE
jgi:hypothetical protein